MQELLKNFVYIFIKENATSNSTVAYALIFTYFCLLKKQKFLHKLFSIEFIIT